MRVSAGLPGRLFLPALLRCPQVQGQCCSGPMCATAWSTLCPLPVEQQRINPPGREAPPLPGSLASGMWCLLECLWPWRSLPTVGFGWGPWVTQCWLDLQGGWRLKVRARRAHGCVPEPQGLGHQDLGELVGSIVCASPHMGARRSGYRPRLPRERTTWNILGPACEPLPMAGVCCSEP